MDRKHEGFNHHVPHEDINQAARVRKIMEDAGLEICLCGSSCEAVWEYAVYALLKSHLKLL